MDYRLAGVLILCLSIAGCGGGSQPTTASLPEGKDASPAPAKPAPAAFNQTLTLQGISFSIEAANTAEGNKLTITPSGLEMDNTPIVREVSGKVTGADVADLNVDGSPEIYVYLRSTGAQGPGQLIAYSANKRKSLSEIYLPPITDDPKASLGYAGLDEFRVVESTVVQRFPLYEAGPEGKPTGKTRQLQYKLAAGEAGWKLRLDRVVEY